MVLEKVKAILAEQFDVEEDKVTADTDLQEDLGADSLDVVDLLMSIEDEFGVEVPDDEIENINSKDIKDGSILSLLIKDTDSIEVYGIEAERAAKSNNLPLVRVNGVPVLSFPNTKDGKKALATCVGRTLLTEISIQQLTDWYHSHKVLMEKENKKGK